MKIRNARIEEVLVNVNFPGPKTQVTIKTHSASGDWTYNFDIPISKYDTFALRAMVEFSGVKNTEELKGRIIREVTCQKEEGFNSMEGRAIREVVCNNSEVIGFGDPIEDRFILFNHKEEFFSMNDFFKF